MVGYPQGPNVPSARVAPRPGTGPGAQFSAADLTRANLSPEAVGRLIATAQQSPDTLALLAAILRNQKKNNAAMQVVPYDLSTYRQQRVLAQNPLRSYLLIQNVSMGDILVLLEDASANVVDYSANTTPLVTQQRRAIRIIGGGYFEPLVAPTNPITVFTLNAAAVGTITEGQ